MVARGAPWWRWTAGRGWGGCRSSCCCITSRRSTWWSPRVRLSSGCVGVDVGVLCMCSQGGLQEGESDRQLQRPLCGGGQLHAWVAS